ncbi:hypothetical protein [Marinobacter sp.]|uniref:hypothetical protein n=1 Tax=Marinobacter sp. TaxID=50741 RepID=UPI0035C6FE85
MNEQSELQDFVIEWGSLFRVRETVQSTSESALEKHLMAIRPEIFPVQIQRVLTWNEMGVDINGVAA